MDLPNIVLVPLDCQKSSDSHRLESWEVGQTSDQEFGICQITPEIVLLKEAIVTIEYCMEWRGVFGLQQYLESWHE